MLHKITSGFTVNLTRIKHLLKVCKRIIKCPSGYGSGVTIGVEGAMDTTSSTCTSNSKKPDWKVVILQHHCCHTCLGTSALKSERTVLYVQQTSSCCGRVTFVVVMLRMCLPGGECHCKCGRPLGRTGQIWLWWWELDPWRTSGPGPSSKENCPAILAQQLQKQKYLTKIGNNHIHLDYFHSNNTVNTEQNYITLSGNSHLLSVNWLNQQLQTN